uniref:Uncharacterized protein n=1 Tax=Anopheles melas TaxID=34690 RepID=A0A182UG35_9DIPT
MIVKMVLVVVLLLLHQPLVLLWPPPAVVVVLLLQLLLVDSTLRAGGGRTKPDSVAPVPAASTDCAKPSDCTYGSKLDTYLCCRPQDAEALLARPLTEYLCSQGSSRHKGGGKWWVFLVRNYG